MYYTHAELTSVVSITSKALMTPGKLLSVTKVVLSMNNV